MDDATLEDAPGDLTVGEGSVPKGAKGDKSSIKRRSSDNDMRRRRIRYKHQHSNKPSAVRRPDVGGTEKGQSNEEKGRTNGKVSNVAAVSGAATKRAHGRGSPEPPGRG